MAGNTFARKMMLKHGWKEGSGLGKNENGIKEPIKVKIKNDTTGVGHDPGKEFTFHWWDHVFNKAASNIDVQTTEKGVELKPSSTASKKAARTFENKNMLYSRFVKKAVLDPTQPQTVEVSCHGDTDTDTDEDDDKSKSTSKLTEEELFASCEGRTAHKGARHGLKQNAKLLRIQQQEQLYLQQIKARANQKQADMPTNHSRDKDLGVPTTNGKNSSISTVVNHEQSSEQRTPVENDGADLASDKPKKRKKKKKTKDTIDTKLKLDDGEQEYSVISAETEIGPMKCERSPSKKKKIKDRKRCDESDILTAYSETVKESKKKRKQKS